mmetsp:Transcript_46172/g.90171  ORF Transcript_46172/g.90171 Transcript_46172/m.90171 type:complete len:239 (+) Transcript_46172:105-821(+)
MPMNPSRLNRSFTLGFGVALLSLRISDAFVLYSPPSRLQLQKKKFHVQPLQMAGFGASGGGSKKKKTKGAEGTGDVGAPLKLNAKTQWDRYLDLAGATAHPVAVRTVGADDWIGVGDVRSAGDAETAAAVAVQRGLLVEHARRLYPGRLRRGDTVEWGYGAPGGDDGGGRTFVAVDKTVLDGAPAGVEGRVGFEGTPDPKSGFYCSPDAGRISDKTDAASQRSTSKSLLDKSVLPRRK